MINKILHFYRQRSCIVSICTSRICINILYVFQVRSTIRNEWAHCNLTVWDDAKYVQSLQRIEDLIYFLRLDVTDEKETIEELEKWRKNGNALYLGLF